MISEFLLNIVFNIAKSGFSALPDVSLDLNSSAFEYFLAICRAACYLLPMGTVGKIIAIIFVLSVLRIIVATIKTVWDLLPFA